MSNVLDLYDQTYFSFGRAAGVTNLLQCVWVYDRGIDVDGLRRFHHQLQQGLLSRRIERSPLPFGRHRWVSANRQPELEIVATPRPREEFYAWLDEQANVRLDAEHGPGWHLAVLPFTDGGAGVTLVVSHCLVDGVGLCEALADAASGNQDPISWPAGASRRRWQALGEDIRQTVRDLPAIGRAVVAAAQFARRQRGAAGTAAGRQSWPPKPTNVSLCQRRRSLSTPTSGTPAPRHSGAPATRCSRGWRPGSPNEWDGSPQTASPPRRYPSTSARPAIPGPTPSPMSTSPSTLHPQQPTCAKSAPRQSKP